MTSGLARIDSLLARVIGTNAPRVVSVIGAGGSGAEEAAGALAVGLHESGRTVTRWRGRRLERDDEGSALADLLSRRPGDLDPLAARQGLAERIAPGGALVLQDAQWLDRSSVAALVGVADRADELDVTVVAFRRDWPRSQHLPALDEIAARTGDVVRWGPSTPRSCASDWAT